MNSDVILMTHACILKNRDRILKNHAAIHKMIHRQTTLLSHPEPSCCTPDTTLLHAQTQDNNTYK